MYCSVGRGREPSHATYRDRHDNWKNDEDDVYFLRHFGEHRGNVIGGNKPRQM